MDTQRSPQSLGGEVGGGLGQVHDHGVVCLRRVGIAKPPDLLDLDVVFFALRLGSTSVNGAHLVEDRKKVDMIHTDGVDLVPQHPRTSR